MHRPRLIANFIREYGWNPIVLTVSSEYYEEKPDNDMRLLVSEDTEVIYSNAFRVVRPRIIGDIGIRAFFHLYRKAREIIKEKPIDFIWIPVPSFYVSLLGRLLFEKTQVPYGIDYIDPWIRDISNQSDWRHKISILIAKFLEPIAVKKASLITGVSYEYYRPVLERNFKFNNEDKGKGKYVIHHASFPYGFDPRDHGAKPDNLSFPWDGKKWIRPWVYAGAFLPNSRIFVKLLFEVISGMRSKNLWDDNIRLYFMGTGKYRGRGISDYARESGIDDIVYEDRSRFPFLFVLNALSASDTAMVIGSTEKHYTASKVYQALLSRKPVWAVFHHDSSAVRVMEECNADRYLVRYTENMSDDAIKKHMKESLLKRLHNSKWQPNLNALEKYSAGESARILAMAIDTAIRKDQ